MTSWPCSASSAAATDESTPPDIATTIRTFVLTPSTVYHEGTKKNHEGHEPFCTERASCPSCLRDMQTFVLSWLLLEPAVFSSTLEACRPALARSRPRDRLLPASRTRRG